MLSIFAKDPSSKFGQYLRKCEAENGDIGQVSIRPSSIYVNISSQKVFSCPVKIDKYGSTSFSLTWDKSTN